MSNTSQRLTRSGILVAALLLLGGAHGNATSAAGTSSHTTNVVLITLDDMSQNSLGIYGCQVAGITPNLDALARQGLRFEHAHVTIAVCQPCRAVWMTGRYPHRNGALGFEPIAADVPTLPEQLKRHGYYLGLLGKTTHVVPTRAETWDVRVPAGQLGQGRRGDLYFEHVSAAIVAAKREGKPFFLMVNIHDPHRPFADREGNRRQATGNEEPKNTPRDQPIPRQIEVSEISVPEFLPDLPAVRREIAQYYTSVFRADDSVGQVLRALGESGAEEQTIVMLLSDHGMPFPFAKTNCYLQSTRTPWIIRWPGKIEPDQFDQEHLVSGIDLAPTLLDLLDLPPLPGIDGRSFRPILEGEHQDDRGQVLTHFHRTSARRDYPMRSIVTKQRGYIWNPWSNGELVFRNESQSGLTWAAMKRHAETDEALAERVKLFSLRVTEELFDYEHDPNALHNLIDDPQFQTERAQLRKQMLDALRATGDPLADEYQAFLDRLPPTKS